VEIYVGSAQRSQSFSEPPCKDLPQEKLPGPEGGLVHQLTKFWVDNNSIESEAKTLIGAAQVASSGQATKNLHGSKIGTKTNPEHLTLRRRG